MELDGAAGVSEDVKSLSADWLAGHGVCTVGVGVADWGGGAPVARAEIRSQAPWV